MFILLQRRTTSPSGGMAHASLLINTNKIVSATIKPEEAGSTITLDGGVMYPVRESVQQIKALIQQSWNED